MNNPINTIIIVIILIYTLYAAYKIGSNTQKEPYSNFIWIGSDRVHIDSTIHCSDIISIDTHEKIGEYIQVTYKGNSIYIECLDDEEFTGSEYRESWLMMFRGDL